MSLVRSRALRGRDIEHLLDIIPSLYTTNDGLNFEFKCGPTLCGIHPTPSPRWAASEVRWSQSVVDAVFAAINEPSAVSLNSLKLSTGEVECPAVRRIPHNLSEDRVREISREGPRLVYRDPFYNVGQKIIPSGRVLIDDDYHTRRQLESSEAYQEYYRPFGSRFQISFAVPSYHLNEVAFVCVMRWATPFTERERTLGELLQQHIYRAHRLRRDGKRKSLEDRDPSCLDSLGLTPRQTEVLFWLACGKRDGEIATILGTTWRTITTHTSTIYKRLGVENRASAIRVAMETV